MPYHIPFSQRNHNRAPGPIYIGFDQPVSIQKRKGRFNWAAFIGLMLALLSPLTLFVAAPLALVFSLFGLRRSPRKMATVATVLSLAGTGVLTVLGIAAIQHHQHHERIVHERVVEKKNRHKTSATKVTLGEAKAAVVAWRDENGNHVPELAEGMDITVQFRDAWDRELYYEPLKDGCLIRSAGPDGSFRTRDDVTCRIEGLPGDGPVETSAQAESPAQ